MDLLEKNVFQCDELSIIVVERFVISKPGMLSLDEV